MKRRSREVVTLLIFLLLGAVVNVAVAWGGALWSSPDNLTIWWWGQWRRADIGGAGVLTQDGWAKTEELWYAERSEHLRAEVPAHAESWSWSPKEKLPRAREAELMMRFRVSIDRQMLRTQLEPGSPPYRPYYFLVISTGWPCRALNTDTFASDGDSWLVRWFKDHSRDHYGYASPYKVLLVPLCVLWPGFALNTLFYAAILWLLFALPGALRRWRRLKRGLCPACAYPVGTNEVCTECGRPVPSSLRGRAAGLRVEAERAT